MEFAGSVVSGGLRLSFGNALPGIFESVLSDDASGHDGLQSCLDRPARVACVRFLGEYNGAKGGVGGRRHIHLQQLLSVNQEMPFCQLRL